jgi:hypothetical protein
MPTQAEAHFRATAPRYMKLLMADFGFSLEDAAAVFGNLGHESKGLTDLQEDKPVVAGSRGGFGWAQWTGPRRMAYEAWCKKHGKDPKADDTNYAYLFVELKGDEKKAVAKTKEANGINEKVEAFCNTFLRPGIPHMASRKRWAGIALDAFRTASVAEGLAPKPATPAEPQTPASEAPTGRGGLVAAIIAVLVAIGGIVIAFFNGGTAVKALWDRIWEALVRFRTWLVNGVGTLLILLPELLNAPEVLAVIPQSYQKWVFVGVFLLNILMRPRPATMAKDPEAQVAKAVAKAEGPVTVTVKQEGVAEPLKTVRAK